jgi:uncharacterized C2H2 Zn-finger protein
MQLAKESDEKFWEISSNRTGRVDEFGTSNLLDTGGNEVYDSIQTYAEIENTADYESQIEPRHAGDIEEYVFKDDMKLAESLSIKDEGESEILNTECNKEQMSMKDGSNEMGTGSDETATTDENARQRRCMQAEIVTSFGNSGNEMGNSSKISSGPGTFECHCGKIFSHKRNLYTHKKTHDTKFEASLRCLDCGKKFSRKVDLNRHIKSIHQGYFYECPICGNKLSDHSNSIRHIKKQHPGSNAKPIEKCDKK